MSIEPSRRRDLREDCLLVCADDFGLPALCETVVDHFNPLALSRRWSYGSVKRKSGGEVWAFKLLLGDTEPLLADIQSRGEKEPGAFRSLLGANLTAEGYFRPFQRQIPICPPNGDLLLSQGRRKLAQSPARSEPRQKLHRLDGVALPRGVGTNQERQRGERQRGLPEALEVLDCDVLDHPKESTPQGSAGERGVPPFCASSEEGNVSERQRTGPSLLAAS